MAKTARRSSSSAPISKSAIDHASSTLQELPEKARDSWSLREAVAFLQEPIVTALNRGYSYEEVAKMLSEAGVEISASSLKSYLSAARRQKDGALPTKGRRTGRRSRKTQDQATILEAAHVLSEATSGSNHESLNGVAAHDSEEDVTEDGDEDLEEVSAQPPSEPTRRRTRTSSTRSNTSSTKTAAKSKPTARSRSKSTDSTKTSRRKRSQSEDD